MENQTEKTKKAEEVNDVVETEMSEVDKLEILHAKIKEENDRYDARENKEMLGGTAEAGMQTPKPVPMTDIEFANKVKNGDINPLKEDGFI